MHTTPIICFRCCVTPSVVVWFLSSNSKLLESSIPSLKILFFLLSCALMMSDLGLLMGNKKIFIICLFYLHQVTIWNEVSDRRFQSFTNLFDSLRTRISISKMENRKITIAKIINTKLSQAITEFSDSSEQPFPGEVSPNKIAKFVKWSVSPQIQVIFLCLSVGADVFIYNSERTLFLLIRTYA